MTLKEKRQMAAALPQHPQRAARPVDRAPEFLRTDDAAELLCYRGKHRLRSLYRFLAAHGIRPRRRFRTLLIKKSDLVRAIEGRSSSRQQSVSA